MVFAQATTITTTCPTSFTCAFSAAETLSLVTSKNVGSAGQPDVYVGYIAFQGSTVTMTGQQNVNGTVGAIGTATSGSPSVLTGSCTTGINGQPAIITFPGTASNTRTQLSFVTNVANTELQFILTQDINSTSVTSANSVRIGVCRQ